jgi:hypothetical protein
MAPACFLPGTRIAMANGPARRIEALRPGDLVATRDHGPQPLLMLLRQVRLLPPGDHPHRPLRIAPGALGPGWPRRALRLSPAHRLLLAGPEGPRLVAAARLVGRRGVRPRLGLRRAVYLHLVLAVHAIVMAEGAEAESFHPGPAALRALPPDQRGALRRALGPLRPRPLAFAKGLSR